MLALLSLTFQLQFPLLELKLMLKLKASEPPNYYYLPDSYELISQTTQAYL